MLALSVMDEKDVIMIGAGGHGKSVINVLWHAGFQVKAIIDDAPDTWGGSLLGVPIFSPDSEVAKMEGAAAIIAIGDNESRKEVSEKFCHFNWITAISPAATIYPSANIGEGCVVMPGVVVGADATIGEHVIVSAQSVVAHDCAVENFAHIAPGVLLGGNVTVREGAFLAIGSRVIPRITIGSWAMLGAGATAMRDIPDRGKAYGPSARTMPS